MQSFFFQGKIANDEDLKKHMKENAGIYSDSASMFYMERISTAECTPAMAEEFMCFYSSKFNGVRHLELASVALRPAELKILVDEIAKSDVLELLYLRRTVFPASLLIRLLTTQPRLRTVELGQGLQLQMDDTAANVTKALAKCQRLEWLTCRGLAHEFPSYKPITAAMQIPTLANLRLEFHQDTIACAKPFWMGYVANNNLRRLDVNLPDTRTPDIGDVISYGIGANTSLRYIDLTAGSSLCMGDVAKIFRAVHHGDARGTQISFTCNMALMKPAATDAAMGELCELLETAAANSLLFIYMEFQMDAAELTPELQTSITEKIKCINGARDRYLTRPSDACFPVSDNATRHFTRRDPPTIEALTQILNVRALSIIDSDKLFADNTNKFFKY